MNNKPFPNLYLTGRAGSGKDTQAALLAPYGYTRIGLADPIKELAGFLIGISRDEVERRKKELRPLLIAMGQGLKHPKFLICNWDLIPIKLRAKMLHNFLTTYKPLNITRFEYALELGLFDGVGTRDLWLHAFTRKASEVRGPVVVTDCRLPFEAAFFRKLGFKGARLYISEETAKQRLFERDGTTDFSFFKNATEIHADTLPVDWTIDGGMDKDWVHHRLVDYLKEAR